MNSEELELSLRAEFEGYMNGVLAKMRQDASELQKNFESEFEKHKAQMDEAFRRLSERFDTAVDFDKAFTESVTEHLRLARDEGAQITARALGEAEKLGNEAATRGFGQLRNAINDIRRNTTQASILRSLVESAANFAPRGAFFIVKNDHLIGWKAFGDMPVDENTVRSIHFPVSDNTILSRSISELSVRSGTASDFVSNGNFLEPLSFGAPDRCYAFPLAARGRGVAVLYADGGDSNDQVNIDALETLVSFAGLHVELLAAANAQPAAEPAHEVASEAIPVEDVEEVAEPEYAGEVAVAELAEAVPEDAVAETDEAPAPEIEDAAPADELPVAETAEYSLSETNFDDAAAVDQAEVEVAEEPVPDAAVVEEAIPEAEAEGELASDEPKRRFRERVVDLPIEVSEQERRSHSDARRFARLLVSEIRLYNEQKVVEARESGDIYEILKEAIDRSREMYDKRVQPEVASKFDYFHYELVNNLADGDEEKLGAGYLAVKA